MHANYGFASLYLTLTALLIQGIYANTVLTGHAMYILVQKCVQSKLRLKKSQTNSNLKRKKIGIVPCGNCTCNGTENDLVSNLRLPLVHKISKAKM